MAYSPYYPTPQYFPAHLYQVPPANATYVRPLTPEPDDNHRKLRKKQNRWSFPGYAQLAQNFPPTPPPTPQKPRRVLWEADYSEFFHSFRGARLDPE